MSQPRVNHRKVIAKARAKIAQELITQGISPQSLARSRRKHRQFLADYGHIVEAHFRVRKQAKP